MCKCSNLQPTKELQLDEDSPYSLTAELQLYMCGIPININREIVILNKFVYNRGTDSFTYEAIIIIRCYIFHKTSPL